MSNIPYQKAFVLLGEDKAFTPECYVVPEQSIQDFQKHLSKSPIFFGNDTLFPNSMTELYGLFEEPMLFKGKIMDTEELIVDIGTIGDSNYYMIIYRIDFYNVQVKTSEDNINTFSIEIETNKFKQS
jgi:hypothetical protein